MTARKLGRRPGKPNTRERILDEAEYIIATKGPDGFTLQEVADRVGIRPPSIFSHFKGIPALTEEVYRRVLQGLYDAIPLEFEVFNERAVRRVLRAFISFLSSNPAHVRLILQQLSTGSRNHGAMQSFNSGEKLVQELVGGVQELIDQALEKGLIRKVLAEDFLSITTGAVLGRLAWNEYEDWEEDNWSEEVVRIQREIELLIIRYLAP